MTGVRRPPANPVPLSSSAYAAAGDGRVARPVELPAGFVERLRGACETVTEDVEARIDAGRDWWPLALVWATGGETPAVPAVVALPSSTDEVAALLRLCDEARVPVTPVAGRSGVCGGSVPVFGGVSLDLTRLTGIVDVDADSLLVDVRAGTFGDDFEAELGASHGLTAGHWPQSMALSTVGGWLACRSAGQMSTRYGKIEDIVAGLEVVLASGAVVRTGGGGPRAAVGPDLTQVFVGSEGTLGVITSAALRVHPKPPAERRSAWSFPTFVAGLDVMRRILRRGATPAVLRLYDPVESQRQYKADGAVLLVLDEAGPHDVAATMQVVEEECHLGGATELSAAHVQTWMDHRNDVSALGALIQRGIVLDTCEVSARWSALPGIYERATAAVMEVPGALVASAHQSHSYLDGGCLYFTFAGRPPEGTADDADAVAAWAESFYRSAWDAVSRVTLEAGGSLSHHHGVGLNRSRYVADALGTAFPVLVALKQALDPNGILNPGKLGLPSPFGEVPWP